VILLAGDNGGLDNGQGRPTENAPLRAGKGTAYEGGVRTPTIAYWPGVTEPGSTSDEPVITMDFYPTVLDIAGVQSDQQVDGVSLKPILQDPSAKLGRDTLYWHYPHYHNFGANPHSRIREGDWRLVEFYEDNHVELYNLADDIGEEHDLAAEMPEKAAELRAKLHAWRESVGAQDPVSNPDYDPKKAKR
jgi:arylsulfatase A-like enzyme